MRDESWYKMLVVSTILHLIVVTAISIPIKKSAKRFELTSTYSVNLVGDMAAGGLESTFGQAAPIREENKIKAATQKKETQHITKPQPERKRQIPERKASDAISISKKKPPVKDNTISHNHLTGEELNKLERRIGQIKKKTDYLDVTRFKSQSETAGRGLATKGAGSGSSGYGLPISSQGSGRPLDLVSQKYIFDIWERIKEAWGLPGSYTTKKDLESIVTIKVRKDGRIIDINFEKRSGNRLYDESILRALRSIDPLPPIPDSFNSDTIEIGFRFLPGDIS